MTFVVVFFVEEDLALAGGFDADPLFFVVAGLATDPGWSISTGESARALSSALPSCSELDAGAVGWTFRRVNNDA